ncbi:MAG: hypothetical protein HN714_08725 [Formosa sp.]|nr:hypothetical protein [Formosa sp.]
MNPSIEIGATFICFILILVALYGAIKQKREVLLFGVCFFSTLPIMGELFNYAEDSNIFHLVIIMVFIVQVVITLPIRAYDSDRNSLVVALNRKIGYGIITANVCQGILVLIEDINVPRHFGYMHFAICLIMLYSVIRPEKRV